MDAEETMEFVIKKSLLVRELQTIAGVVEKRATIPILANLLIEAKGERLQIGASDLEVTIRGVADATVVREGSVTLPAGKLHEIARSLPESDVQFKLLDRNQVAISCERTRYRIAGQPRDDFPSFPEVRSEAGIRLPGGLVRKMIERVAFAITTEDPRYSLNGALVKLTQGRLTMVATDGHRLAYASKEIEGLGAKNELNVIVPRKALGELLKMSAETGEDEEIVLGKAEGHIFFVVGEYRLTSNVLEGTFPRYENVMPERCDVRVTVPTEDLTQAVRRVSLLASDRLGRAIRLALSEGKLELSSQTEMGEAHETLTVEYGGAEMAIGFNARYLLEYLSVVGSPSVALELNPVRPGDDPARASEPGDKPGQLTPDPGTDMDYRYIVMPMHI